MHGGMIEITTSPSKSDGDTLTSSNWNTHTITLDQLTHASAAAGDVVVRDGTSYTRKAVGTNLYGLVSDTTQGDKLNWAWHGKIITSATMGGNAQTVTISSLATFKHYLLMVAGATNASGLTRDIEISINGVAGTAYEYTNTLLNTPATTTSSGAAAVLVLDQVAQSDNWSFVCHISWEDAADTTYFQGSGWKDGSNNLFAFGGRMDTAQSGGIASITFGFDSGSQMVTGTTYTLVGLG